MIEVLVRSFRLPYCLVDFSILVSFFLDHRYSVCFLVCRCQLFVTAFDLVRTMIHGPSLFLMFPDELLSNLIFGIPHMTVDSPGNSF